MPCVLLSKDEYVCIFYKLSIISLHREFNKQVQIYLISS